MGTHAELLAQNGYYREIYEMQHGDGGPEVHHGA
jgi:ABC-type multidrug transport system fused ATPase/permease subunit